MAAAPWAWAVAAWVRICRSPESSGWIISSNDKAAGLFLAAFALPAAGPAFIASLSGMHSLASSISEAPPDRTHAREQFRRLMGDPPAGIGWLYHTRRSLDSLQVNLFQISVVDDETGRELLRSRGFGPAKAALERWEIDFQPQFFPIAWLPFSLGSDVEVWRADEATAWLDAENGAVYIVVYPGWKRPVDPSAPRR